MRVLVMALLLAGSAAAEPLVVDPAGDVLLEAADQPLQDPAGRFGPADLASLEVLEGARDVTFMLGVAGLQRDAEVAYVDRVEYHIQFRLNAAEFTLVVVRNMDPSGQPSYSADLWVVRDGRFEEGRARPEVTVDAAAGTLAVRMMRDTLSDANGRPPLHGDVLQDVRVEALTVQMGSMCASSCIQFLRARDAMPDQGLAPPYSFSLGAPQEGTARLESLEPYRLSNGGAATFVYSVTARNLAAESSSFRLGVTQVPGGWSVALPAERLHLEGKESAELPILLTTQSAHQHGGSAGFVLEMASERDASVGRIELGISYSDTPQPAGHHPQLWLHSSSGSQDMLTEAIELALGYSFQRFGYMNALEEDPADRSIPVYGNGMVVPGVDSRFAWEIPLRPGLGIGLDFDVREPASLTIPIGYGYAASDVTFSASLLHLDAAGTETLLGEVPPQAPVDFELRQTHTFDVEMAMRPEADFVPYERGSGLLLRIQVDGMFNGPFMGPESGLRLEPGGSMRLPLREYHDPLDSFYAASKLLTFDAPYLERLVNPGKTTIFETALRSHGSESFDVQLNLTGSNAQWARILGDTTFRVGGSLRSVAVAVTVPPGVPDGASADLVLQAVAVEQPHRRAVIDLLAIVDEEADHPDDTGRLDALEKELRADKKSPAAGMVWLLAALALLRRRT